MCIRDSSQTLKDLLDTHPDACPGGSPGVLVKLIDSAERLTLQVDVYKRQVLIRVSGFLHYRSRHVCRSLSP